MHVFRREPAAPRALLYAAIAAGVFLLSAATVMMQLSLHHDGEAAELDVDECRC